MRPTLAMKRPRAHSDPGSLAFGREDMELQPMGAPAQDSMGTDVPATTPAEPQCRLSEDATGGADSTSIGVAMEVPPVSSSAGSSVQPSAQQNAIPGRADSTGATAKVCTTEILVRSGIDDHKRFFQKYNDIVPPSELKEFRSLVGRERDFKAHLWQPYSASKERGLWTKTDDPWTPSRLQKLKDTDHGVLMIEDVDIRCLDALDAVFGLDPAFVVRYVSSAERVRRPFSNQPDGYHQTETGMSGTWYMTNAKAACHSSWPTNNSSPHLPTVLQRSYKLFKGDKTRRKDSPWWQEPCRRGRSLEKEGKDAIISVIACYCLSENLRLVLVESAPPLLERIERPFDLRMLFTNHLEIPPSLNHLMSGRRPLSLYECFAWHLNERFSMFPQTETDTYKAFQELILMSYEAHPHRKEAGDIVTYSLWVLSDRQWRDNLTFLRRAFAERRDKALARPGMDTYLPLIQLRQLMVGMRAHLPEVLGRNLQHEESSEVFKPDEFTPSAWKQTLTKASKDIRKMNTELDDEIHLIIGAVTVQDSDANKQQSERATLLTLLAAVYLPLTLVTGIFGMNITEIEAGKPNSRACGEVLAVVAACTVVFVFAYRHWRAWRRGQQEKERMELGFQKDV